MYCIVKTGQSHTKPRNVCENDQTPTSPGLSSLDMLFAPALRADYAPEPGPLLVNGTCSRIDLAVLELRHHSPWSIILSP